MKTGYLFLASLSFIIVCSALYLYSYLPTTYLFAEVELKKMFTIETPVEKTVIKETIAVKIDTLPTFVVPEDTSKIVYASIPEPVLPDSSVDDSTRHRVLLIGDSEAGGIKNVLNDYCQSNGHKLVATVEWSSATTLNFAKSDTISKIIKRYRPTFVFVLFGLNEVLAKDYSTRKALARQFQKRLNGLPYAWIGPTNWGYDYVVTDAFQAAADSAAFFSSKHLLLPKASDGRHPSLPGYRIWMGNVASWLQESSRWKIRMMPPARFGYPKKYKAIVLNAADYRGY
jgi:lysophospholipase L1-like esterase